MNLSLVDFEITSDIKCFKDLIESVRSMLVLSSDSSRFSRFLDIPSPEVFFDALSEFGIKLICLVVQVEDVAKLST